MIIEIPKLSFCITCKNRFYQIKDTLIKNLNDNKMYKHFIEFVLVDFGSTDGLNEWIKDKCMKYVKEGYLKYYYTDELVNWHASIVKNTSHIYANNDILVNLDCDNFTGRNGGKFIIQQFMKYGENIVLQQNTGKFFDGAFGRISVNKKYFMKIGGYNEDFEPMGHQDIDLRDRLINIGLKYVWIPNGKFNKYIKNTKTDSIKNTNSKLDWFQMVRINGIRSKLNNMEAKIIANSNGFGIRKNIYDIYGNLVIK